MKPRGCSEEEVENTEFLTRLLACSFQGHSGFDVDQSKGVIHDAWRSQEQKVTFSSRNKSYPSTIKKEALLEF